MYTGYEFDASLGYEVRLCLRNPNLKIPTQNAIHKSTVAFGGARHDRPFSRNTGDLVFYLENKQEQVVHSEEIFCARFSLQGKAICPLPPQDL